MYIVTAWENVAVVYACVCVTPWPSNRQVKVR